MTDERIIHADLSPSVNSPGTLVERVVCSYGHPKRFVPTVSVWTSIATGTPYVHSYVRLEVVAV